METFDLIKTLADEDFIGGVGMAKEKAAEILSKFAEVKITDAGVIGYIKGSGSKTILFDAHIDQIGMVVTAILEDGFLKVAPCGGIDSRILPAQPVKIYGKKIISGVFCSTPPHLSGNDEKSADIKDLCIDTGLGAKAKDLISLGDRVVFDTKAEKLHGTVMVGKSFDDRSSCAALIKAAELIKKDGTVNNIIIELSDQEELGGRGALISAFAHRPDCAVAVDVSFGNTPGIEPDKCGVLGKGPMIGISPTLDYSVTEIIKNIANKDNMEVQREIMGGKTSTNADEISIAASGIPSGLISIPLRNMHTPGEIIDTRDVDAVARLLYLFSKEEF